MMKMKAPQAESVLCIAKEASEVNKKCREILETIEAKSAVSKISSRERYALSGTQEEKLLRSAINEVDTAEESVLALQEVFSRRKMKKDTEHAQLFSAVELLCLRLYRVMWELSLDDGDKRNMREVIKKIANLSVWEDKPCGRYEKVANEMTGTIAFAHCHGVTFVTYKLGKATSRAWSVLRNTLEEAVVLARTDIAAAVKLMS